MSELIDRAELFNRLATAQDKADCFKVIQEMPESIVRCRDCKHNWDLSVNKGRMNPRCNFIHYERSIDFFCAFGERRKE